MQVYHSFLHKNDWLANCIARLMSCAGYFLSWNRAVLNCVQQTCTRSSWLAGLTGSQKVRAIRLKAAVNNFCRSKIAHSSMQ